MWETKYFKTKKALDRFMEANKHKYQMTEIFINNGYGVEYRKLRRVY